MNAILDMKSLQKGLR